jgi:LacI family transcriptional regulator
VSEATILDVARKAKVSAGTVSRVLNRKSVAPDLAERVRKAVAALNYAPRQRKATMAELRPLEGKNVLLLLLGMDRSLATLPVVATALHGVERALVRSGAHLLIADVPAADHVPDVLRAKRIDAVIVKGALQGNLAAQIDPTLRRRLDELPKVWVLGRPKGFAGDVVQADDLSIGQMAAGLLTERGHRHLAFISPKPSQAALLRRQAGFTFFAAQAGATVSAYVGDERAWSFPSPAVAEIDRVQELIDRLLVGNALRGVPTGDVVAAGPGRPSKTARGGIPAGQRPTAIFAPDDSIGVMTARALAARDVKVGKEISLISCNNERPLLMGIHPALTTIDVHAETIGARAVDQLAWRTQHPQEPSVDIGVEPSLVEGDSVASL